MKIWLGLSLIFLSSLLYSQNEIAIYNSGMNVFYAGIRNELAVVVNGYKSADLVPVCTKAELIKKWMNVWVIIPDTGVKSIKVHITNTNGDTLTDRFGWSFRVYRTPDADLYIGKTKINSVADTVFLEKRSLWPGPFIGAKYDNFLLGIRAEVRKYEIEVVRNNKKIYDFGKIVQDEFKWSKTYTSDSIYFHQLHKDVIIDDWVETLRYKLKENDQIVLKNIEVLEADGRVRIVPKIECYWKP
jgi:hypothetical protein